jgi:hypothetical protein
MELITVNFCIVYGKFEQVSSCFVLGIVENQLRQPIILVQGERIFAG